MASRRPRRITFETAEGDERWALPVLTREQVLSLPPSCEMVYAARALGIRRSVAYRQASQHGALRYGDASLALQRVGGVWRCRASDLLALLGESAPMAGDGRLAAAG